MEDHTAGTSKYRSAELEDNGQCRKRNKHTPTACGYSSVKLRFVKLVLSAWFWHYLYGQRNGFSEVLFMIDPVV